MSASFVKLKAKDLLVAALQFGVGVDPAEVSLEAKLFCRSNSEFCEKLGV